MFDARALTLLFWSRGWNGLCYILRNLLSMFVKYSGRASRDLKSHILIVLSFSFLCPQTLPRPSSFNHFINNALWVGFYKTDNISEDIKVLKTFISFYPMYCLLHVPWLVIPCDLFIFLSTELITTLSVISCSLWFIRVQTRGWRLRKIIFSFLSFSRESLSFCFTFQFYFILLFFCRDTCWSW